MSESSSALLSRPPKLLGAQTPRVLVQPPANLGTRGQEAIDLAHEAGLVLDEWQQLAINVILSERLTEEGKRLWAPFQCGVIVPRQNGKGGIIEALELFWLFLTEEPLILHSAHEFKTSSEAFLRINALVANNDWLRKRCKKPRTSHGEEGIELLNGRARLRFVARSNSSGRGFTGHKIVFDEAFKLPANVMAALLPTLSAVPNPQILYTTTTPAEVNDDSAQIRSVRDRAISDKPGRVGWLEWSADAATVDPDDPVAWAMANPAMGLRITEDYIEEERGTLPIERFLVERLGVWPADLGQYRVIPDAAWAASVDHYSSIAGDPTFAVEVTPDRSAASIAVAGLREDGAAHIEIVDHAEGTSWVINTLIGVKEVFGAAYVAIDPSSPAGSLIEDLKANGIEVIPVTGQQVSQATALIVDMTCSTRLNDEGLEVPAPKVWHRDDGRMATALASATKRDTGDGGFAWSRKNSTADITPIVAPSLALWASREPRPPVRKPTYVF